MYKVVATDKVCRTQNGSTFSPLATLADQYGRRVQISTDDNCYVLYMHHSNGTYGMTPWWFEEASNALVDVIKKHPLRRYHRTPKKLYE